MVDSPLPTGVTELSDPIFYKDLGAGETVTATFSAGAETNALLGIYAFVDGSNIVMEAKNFMIIEMIRENI